MVVFVVQLCCICFVFVLYLCCIYSVLNFQFIFADQSTSKYSLASCILALFVMLVGQIISAPTTTAPPNHCYFFLLPTFHNTFEEKSTREKIRVKIEEKWEWEKNLSENRGKVRSG